MAHAELWGVVLAGGEGLRLRSLTTDADGVPVPKQFCSLGNGRSMLGDALDRIRLRVPPERTFVVVTEAHRRWWEPELAAHPPERIVVQPTNRGTAVGILAPLQLIAARGPEANVLVAPSDHAVDDATAFEGSLTVALDFVELRPGRVVLLGVEPEGPEGADYGWIVPVPSSGPVRAVSRFVEKPGVERLSALRAQGGLWNSFVFVGRVGTLLGLFERTTPELFRRDPPGRPLDFSRDVLERVTDALAVVTVPECGWIDLGTPDRVARCLARRGRASASTIKIPSNHARSALA